MTTEFRSALSLSVAIVLASVVASGAFLRAKRLDQNIKITGSAKRRIKSDLMIWRTSVSAEAATLAEAYSKLTRDVEKTKAFSDFAGIRGESDCHLRRYDDYRSRFARHPETAVRV